MTEQLNFSIEGEFLTNYFRELCLSGEWSKAVNQLKESLIGIPLDTVIEILSGSKKLIGVNELELSDDNESEKYIKDLIYIYSKYVYKSGSWYELLAIINTIKPTSKINSDFADSKHVSSRIRIYFPSFDDYMFLDGKCCVLERVTLNPPLWLEEELRTNKHVDLNYITKIGFFPEEIQYYDNEDSLLRDIVLHNYSRSDAEDIIFSDAFTTEVRSRESMRKTYENEVQENKINDLREKILEQAQQIGGFMTISSDNGNLYRIPKAPFVRWVSGLYPNLYDSLPSYDWKPLSPSGMKMGGDNPFHTDFVIGSGLNPEDAYRTDFNDAVTAALFIEIPSDMITLAGNGIFPGFIHEYYKPVDPEEVKDKIIVIPYAGVEFFEMAKVAKLTITEKGGPASHLAINSIEHNINLVLLKNAFELSENILYSFDLNQNKYWF